MERREETEKERRKRRVSIGKGGGRMRKFTKRNMMKKKE